jgi:hypothetical protein
MMAADLTKPAIIGATSVAAASAVRWLNGSSGMMDTNRMVYIAAVGAGSSYVAPSLTAAVYRGAMRPLAEAVMSGVVAAGVMYAWTMDSSVALHIPVQALAHIGGSMVATAVSKPSYAAAQAAQANAPATAESVADLAASM